MSRQQGISLISLMIGLLVSMVVVIGMMMVFRNTIQTVAPTSESARSDGERASGVLAAHIMLTDAGFGIGDGVTTFPDPAVDLAVASSATLSGTLSGTKQTGNSRTGNAIVWRKGVDTSSPEDGTIDVFRCEGLFADTDGGLFRLSSTANCASADTNWNTINWTSTPLIRDSRLRAEQGDIVRAITFTLTVNSECSPFGVGVDGILGNITVEMSYPVNVGGAAENITSTTCLANFPPP